MTLHGLCSDVSKDWTGAMALCAVPSGPQPSAISSCISKDVCLVFFLPLLSGREREREGQSKRKSSSREQQVVLQVKLGSLQITFYKPDLIVIVTCRWNFKDTPVPFALRFLVPISAEACCLNSIVYYP